MNECGLPDGPYPFDLSDDELIWLLCHKLHDQYQLLTIPEAQRILDRWDEEKTRQLLDYLVLSGFMECDGNGYDLTDEGARWHNQKQDDFYHYVQDKIHTHHKECMEKRPLEPSQPQPKPEKSPNCCIDDYFGHDNSSSEIPRAAKMSIDALFGGKHEGQSVGGGSSSILSSHSPPQPLREPGTGNREPTPTEEPRIVGKLIGYRDFRAMHEDILGTVLFCEREAITATPNRVARIMRAANSDYFRQCFEDLIESGFLRHDGPYRAVVLTPISNDWFFDHGNELTDDELYGGANTGDQSYISPSVGLSTPPSGGANIAPSPRIPSANTNRIPPSLLERLGPKAFEFLMTNTNIHHIKCILHFQQPRPPDEILDRFLGCKRIPLVNWDRLYKVTDDHFDYEFTTKKVIVYIKISIYKEDPEHNARVVLKLLAPIITDIEKQVNEAVTMARKDPKHRGQKIPPLKIICANFEHDSEPVLKIYNHVSKPLHPGAIVVSEMERGLEIAQQYNDENMAFDASPRFVPEVGIVSVPEAESTTSNSSLNEQGIASCIDYNRDIAMNPGVKKPSEVTEDLKTQLHNSAISVRVINAQGQQLKGLHNNLGQLIETTDKLMGDLYNKHNVQFSGGLRQEQRMEMNTAQIFELGQTVKAGIKELVENQNDFLKKFSKAFATPPGPAAYTPESWARSPAPPLPPPPIPIPAKPRPPGRVRQFFTRLKLNHRR